MHKKLSILLFFTILFARAANAQEIPHPIDKAFDECLAKDTSESNLYNCAFEAYAAWDRQMDKEFKKLLKNLRNDKDRAAAKLGQTAWVSYRDNEFKSYDNMFNRPGSYWIALRAKGRIEIVRQRAMQLQAYNDALDKRRR